MIRAQVLDGADAIAAANSDRNEPVLTAPEAADPYRANCVTYLLALGCWRCQQPRSFRVGPGSWMVGYGP